MPKENTEGRKPGGNVRIALDVLEKLRRLKPYLGRDIGDIASDILRPAVDRLYKRELHKELGEAE